MNEPKLNIISLLIKLGVTATVSAVTWGLHFNAFLFAERITSQTIGLMAFLCIPLTSRCRAQFA